MRLAWLSDNSVHPEGFEKKVSKFSLKVLEVSEKSLPLHPLSRDNESIKRAIFEEIYITTSSTRDVTRIRNWTVKCMNLIRKDILGEDKTNQQRRV